MMVRDGSVLRMSVIVMYYIHCTSSESVWAIPTCTYRVCQLCNIGHGNCWFCRFLSYKYIVVVMRCVMLQLRSTYYVSIPYPYWFAANWLLSRTHVYMVNVLVKTVSMLVHVFQHFWSDCHIHYWSTNWIWAWLSQSLYFYNMDISIDSLITLNFWLVRQKVRISLYNFKLLDN